MDIGQFRDLLTQIQTGARVSTAIGEPVQVGDRIVIPVAEVSYAGGGGGGSGKAPAEQAEGSGGGGGGGVSIRPLGCWVVGPVDERWVPALDVNRAMMIGGALVVTMLLTVRAIMRRLH